MSKKGKNVTKQLTFCAALAAMAVVMARLLCINIPPSTRFSLETIPIFIAGMLFGPVAGALVGFVSDVVGRAIFTGINPILCISPTLFGLFAGLFQRMLRKNASVGRLALAFLPGIVLVSWLWQSAALSIAFGGVTMESKIQFFLPTLSYRFAQFAITYVIDVCVVYYLSKSGVFRRIRS